jgi:hypothetical protein
MSLVYSEKVTTAFTDKVSQISSSLGINPNWLMQVMKSESGLNPQAQNIQSGHLVAAGLIQFTAGTATGLGTTQSALLNMNALQQLDYVKKYYLPYKGKLHSYFDVYLVTFFPAAVGKPDSYVFSSKNLSASLIAKQNPAININKDQQITMAEFKQYLENTVPNSVRGIIFGSPLMGIVVFVSMVTLLYFITK